MADLENLHEKSENSYFSGKMNAWNNGRFSEDYLARLTQQEIERKVQKQTEESATDSTGTSEV